MIHTIPLFTCFDMIPLYGLRLFILSLFSHSHLSLRCNHGYAPPALIVFQGRVGVPQQSSFHPGLPYITNLTSNSEISILKSGR